MRILSDFASGASSRHNWCNRHFLDERARNYRPRFDTTGGGPCDSSEINLSENTRSGNGGTTVLTGTADGRDDRSALSRMRTVQVRIHRSNPDIAACGDAGAVSHMHMTRHGKLV